MMDRENLNIDEYGNIINNFANEIGNGLTSKSS